MSYDVGFIIDGLILIFLAVTIFYAARLSLFLKSFRAGREGMQILIRDLSITIDKAESSIHVMKENANVTALELQEVINESKFLSDELRFMNETGDGLATRLEKLASRNRELVDLMENAGGIGTQKIYAEETRHEQVAKAAKEKANKKIRGRDAARSNAQKGFVRDRDSFEINDFEIDDLEVDKDDETDFLALGDDGTYREDLVSERAAHQSQIDTKAKSKVRSFAIFDREHMDDDVENEKAEQLREGERFNSRAEQDLYEALQRKKRVSELS